MDHKKGLLHKLFSRVITLMIVPHDENRMFRFRIPVVIVVLFFCGLISLLTYSGIIIKQDIDYQKAQESVKNLKEKASVLNEEYMGIRQKVQKFKEEEKKLRQMVGLKNKKALLENSGVGGPTKNDQNMLDRILDSDVGKEEIKRSVQNLQAEIDEQMESFDEVKKYISTLSSIWSATPKGTPVWGYITSRYGYRSAVYNSDGSENKDWHAGVDIANRIGTPIKVTAPGKIIFAGKMNGYGMLVIVEHSYGFTTRYGHCSKILVKKGDRVKGNDTIALIGMTGNTTGPHVHYEVRKYGKTMDPVVLDRDFYTKR